MDLKFFGLRCGAASICDSDELLFGVCGSPWGVGVALTLCFSSTCSEASERTRKCFHGPQLKVKNSGCKCQ